MRAKEERMQLLIQTNKNKLPTDQRNVCVCVGVWSTMIEFAIEFFLSKHNNNENKKEKMRVTIRKSVENEKKKKKKKNEKEEALSLLLCKDREKKKCPKWPMSTRWKALNGDRQTNGRVVIVGDDCADTKKKKKK